MLYNWSHSYIFFHLISKTRNIKGNITMFLFFLRVVKNSCVFSWHSIPSFYDLQNALKWIFSLFIWRFSSWYQRHVVPQSLLKRFLLRGTNNNNFESLNLLFSHTESHFMNLHALYQWHVISETQLKRFVFKCVQKLSFWVMKHATEHVTHWKSLWVQFFCLISNMRK